jgi:hypothetical protein
MKSDYNGLVERSKKNQSIDENFNNETPVTAIVNCDEIVQFVGVYLLLLIISPLSLVTSHHIMHTVVLLVASLSPQRCLLVTSAEVCYLSLVFTLLLTVPRLVTSHLGNSIALSTRDFR